MLDECLHNRWACWGWQVQPAWKLRPNTTAGRSPVRHPVDRSGGIGSSRFEFGGRRQKVVGASPRRSPFCAYAARTPPGSHSTLKHSGRRIAAT